ncbi:MAG: SGNH/GDSL hydrolase family protein [Victivallales bacterium]|jgi:lysophospholipase L1-like esterase
MKPDLLSNIDYVSGAAGVKETESGFYASRMTSRLMQHYSATEAEEIRAMNNSGIRVTFISDTSFIEMKLVFGRYSRPIFNTDIVVDRFQKMTFGPQEYCGEFSFNAEFNGKGMKQIEIHLPNQCETTVAGMEIEDGCLVNPAQTVRPGLIFIGDSITQGMAISSPSLTYPAQVATALNKDFHNIAVGGATMDGRVGKLALDIEWNTAFVAFGVNDFNQNRKLSDFSADTEQMLNYLSMRKDSQIYLITPIPWAGRSEPNSLGLQLEEYRRMLKTVAAGFKNVCLINGTQLVPDDSSYFVDNIHPNDKGMGIYAKKLLQKIKQ